MKGHMQDGKFHPHTDYKKGVRKSRDQKAKTEGVRFKKELKVPRNTEIIKVKGTKKEIIKKLMETKQWNGFENISDDGWFSGSIYLDNGEGRSGYAEFRGKVSDGKVEVKMNKNDVPSFWRDLYYDDLFMEATDKVRDTFEEMMTERKARDEEETIFAKKYTVKRINEPVKNFEGKMYVVQSHGQDVTFPMTLEDANARRQKLIEHKDRLT